MRIVGCFVLLILVPTVAIGYSGGPPDGHAGDPPLFHTCTACHSSFPLNSGNGALSLLGVPAAYVPDSTYAITVRITDPGQRRWGFELTVLRESDDLRGGTLLELDPLTTQISGGVGEERDYAKQTLAGTFPNGSQGEWDLLWTAPETGVGATRFYLTGNAANNSNTPIFDFIYSLDRTVPEFVPAGVHLGAGPLSAAELRVEPNPATGSVTLKWDALSELPLLVTVYDALGRRVRSVPVAAWAHGRFVWDARDALGSALPSGTYFLVLQSRHDSRVGRVVLSP